MGEVVVVSGPPGAGKSAVSEVLVERLRAGALVEGDRVFGFLRHGYIPPWRPESHAQNTAVVEAAAAASGRLAALGTVVHDGVVGPWLLPAFLAASGLHDVRYVVLLPPLEVCLRRVRDRRDHPLRDPVVTRHMHADFVRARIDPAHVVADADLDVGAVGDLIAQGLRDGAFRHRPP